MSDLEFERFIAAFENFPRLAAHRQRDIGDELRDHWEERVKDLMATGQSRDRAVEMALDEFGDAAGLAGEFLRIVRTERRRRIMRLSFGGLLVCLAICIGLVAFRPNHAPPTVPMVAAQDVRDPFGAPAATTQKSPQPKVTSNDPFAPNRTDPARPENTQKADAPTVTPAIGRSSDENTERTEKNLTKRLLAEYRGLPLADVLGAFAEQLDVEIYVNRRRLEDSGVARDTPVELNLRQVRGDMLLDLLLSDLGLVYTIRDGIVIVTNREDLASTFEVRVYNCSDLTSLAGAGALPAVPGMPGGFATGAAGFSTGLGASPGTMGNASSSRDSRSASGSSSVVAGSAGPGTAFGIAGGMPAASGGSGSGPAAVATGGGSFPSTMGAASNQNALISVITSTIVPESWARSGGGGTIEPYHGGLLVVNHNPHVHRKIEKLLSMLRAAAKQNPPAVVRER